MSEVASAAATEDPDHTQRSEHTLHGFASAHLRLHVDCLQLLAELSSAYNSRPGVLQLMSHSQTSSPADLHSTLRTYHMHQR
jgi:hypothetical protein